MRIGTQNRSFYAKDCPFLNQDPQAKEKAAAKKGLYFKQGMHGVTGVYKAEKRMDANAAEIKDRIRQLYEDQKEADATLQDINQKMAQAKTDYAVEDDSQEEQDLNLLKKKFDMKHHRISDMLTKEEWARLEELEMTDYQKHSMDLYEMADYWKEKQDDTKRELSINGYAVRAIKLMRLESDAMEEAQRAKEELLENAAKEAVGMLREEAVDSLDEKAEEIKEAAEAKQEQKAEMEEKLEAAKEKKEEAEAKTDGIQKSVSEMTDGVLSKDVQVRDLDAEIKRVLEEEKLLEEELKGLRMNMRV